MLWKPVEVRVGAARYRTTVGAIVVFLMTDLVIVLFGLFVVLAPTAVVGAVLACGLSLFGLIILGRLAVLVARDKWPYLFEAPDDEAQDPDRGGGCWPAWPAWCCWWARARPAFCCRRARPQSRAA